MQKPINHIYLIVLLSILSSVAPIGVDTYLPSIPDIAKAFDVSIEKIEFVKAGKVRRAKLFYLKGRQGKSARIKEKLAAVKAA
jgi:ribosomal protein L19